MSKIVMVMYSLEKKNTEEQDSESTIQYPNAFLVQVTKDITCKHIRQIFPWDRVTRDVSKIIRFGMKANEETYWLDLQDDEPVPYFTASTISLKIS